MPIRSSPIVTIRGTLRAQLRALPSMLSGYLCRSATPASVYHPFLGELRDCGLHGDRAKWMASRAGLRGRKNADRHKAGVTANATHLSCCWARRLSAYKCDISITCTYLRVRCVEGGGVQLRDLTRRGSARSKARGAATPLPDLRPR